jgi:hypothetical protein
LFDRQHQPAVPCKPVPLSDLGAERGSRSPVRLDGSKDRVRTARSGNRRKGREGHGRQRRGGASEHFAADQGLAPAVIEIAEFDFIVTHVSPPCWARLRRARETLVSRVVRAADQPATNSSDMK